eukprot:ANDGO_00852.mRNA.1 hypothetical protein SAMD00019534_084120
MNRSRVLSMYRRLLRSCVNPEHVQSIRCGFRQNKSQVDPAAIQAFLKDAQDRLSFLKIINRNSLLHGQKLSDANVPKASRYVIMDGKLVPMTDDLELASGGGAARPSLKDGGIDPEHLRRHKALLDRQHFRGPMWNNKR